MFSAISGKPYRQWKPLVMQRMGFRKGQVVVDQMDLLDPELQNSGYVEQVVLLPDGKNYITVRIYKTDNNDFKPIYTIIWVILDFDD